MDFELFSEKDAEVLIDQQLSNLKFGVNISRQTSSVEEHRRKLGRLKPDYIIYKTNSKQALAIIEAKKEQKDFDKAIKQGKEYAKLVDCPIVFASNGIQVKTFHTKYNCPLSKNGEELAEFVGEEELLKFLDNSGVFTTEEKVIKSREELINIFKKANNELRSEGIDGGADRFSEFSNILFLKLISEIEVHKEERGETSNIDKAYRWNYFREKRGGELLNYVNDTIIRNFRDKYDDKDIFSNLKIKTPKTLENIITQLDPLSLIDINSDIKGDAFEYFLRQYNSGNKDLGQYFTPRHFVKFMVKLLNPKFGEKVYDPFCGTGGMLVESFKHLTKMTNKDDDAIEFLQKKSIFGSEISSNSRVAKMNMILVGDGHSNIQRKDSLKEPQNNKYDVCITNIPFSQKTKYLNKYDIGKGGGDSACFQHCIQSMKKGGNSRAAIIVPLSFLYQPKYKEVKENIYKKYNLEFHSIFAFPVKAFAPYTDSRAAILYIKGITEGKKKNLWYFDIKDDGYTLNNKRKKKERDGDLDKILLEKYKEVDVKSIRYDEIKKDNFNLIAVNYLKFKFQTNYDMQLLGDLLESTDVRNIGREHEIWSITSRDGFVPSKKMFAEQVFSKDTSEYKLVRPGWFAYSPARVNIGSLNFNFSKNTGAVSPSYITFRIKETLKDKMESKYVLSIFKTKEIQKHIAKLCYGTVRQTLLFENLLKVSIPVPPIKIQKEIGDRYLALEQQRKTIQDAIEQESIAVEAEIRG